MFINAIPVPNLLVACAHCHGSGRPPSLLFRATLLGHPKCDCQTIAYVAFIFCGLTMKGSYR
jgi:hypothetical protein